MTLPFYSFSVLCCMVCFLPWFESTGSLLIWRCSWSAKGCHKGPWSCCFPWKWVIVSILTSGDRYVFLCLHDAWCPKLINLLWFRYGETFPVSAEVLDSSFCLPIGKAKVFLPQVWKIILLNVSAVSCYFIMLFNYHCCAYICPTNCLLSTDWERREGCDHYCLFKNGWLCSQGLFCASNVLKQICWFASGMINSDLAGRCTRRFYCKSEVDIPWETFFLGHQISIVWGKWSTAQLSYCSFSKYAQKSMCLNFGAGVISSLVVIFCYHCLWGGTEMTSIIVACFF